MKKIMFNDAYGLTQSTIEGRKTMTRRLISPRLTPPANERNFDEAAFKELCCAFAAYKVGEVVAVAQSYRDVRNFVVGVDFEEVLCDAYGIDDRLNIVDLAGWRNKMFVKAELMPYRIRITGIKAERLQDISDEDCLREGVVQVNRKCVSKATGVIQMFYPCESLKECAKQEGWGIFYDAPREAFAILIDKVSGRGTWARNPWDVAYEYELVK
ncbi:MAG: hypothetical protein NC226_09670 [Bacteroides cellulosilyticus]|nr:hypothetical protein [Bacteroides cellulosilyticus]